MRSLYPPKTAVPGSQLVMGPHGAPMLDKKGRFQWTMPRHIKVVLHKGIVQVGSKTERRVIKVPVDRGVDADVARHIMAGLRRKRRIEDLRPTFTKVEVPDDLLEEET